LKLLRIIGLWGPVALFMVLIYAFSAPGSIPRFPGHWDKAVHAGAYGMFGLLCVRAFHGGLRPARILPTLWAMLLVLGYAMVDEWHQTRIVGRDASFWDWFADASGAGLALLLVATLVTRRRKPAGPAEGFVEEDRGER